MHQFEIFRTEYIPLNEADLEITTLKGGGRYHDESPRLIDVTIHDEFRCKLVQEKVIKLGTL